MRHSARTHNIAVSVVSPVYNNAVVMTPIIKGILSILSKTCTTYELLLIDDGSTDESSRILKRDIAKLPHIRIIYHTKNEGTAKTYRELYKKATYEGIVLFSLDGEWNVQDIQSLIKASEHNDIVIGKRRKKNYPPGRKLLSFVYNLLNESVFGVQTFDAGSIKFIRKDIITSIPVISHGVFDEAERIIRAQKKGYTITSIPVDHFGSQKKRGLLSRLPLVIEAVVDCIRVRMSL